MIRRIIWLPVVLLSACSFPHETAPSHAALATGVGTQAIITNAPGGIPVPAETGGNSCAQIVPSFRVESDLPKANHVSVDWGHADGYAYLEIVFNRRDTNPVQSVTLKPNEHTNGSGQVSHHTEVVLPVAVYDGTLTFLTSTGCRSRTATFNGLGHGVGSLNGPPDPPKSERTPNPS